MNSKFYWPKNSGAVTATLAAAAVLTPIDTRSSGIYLHSEVAVQLTHRPEVGNKKGILRNYNIKPKDNAEMQLAVYPDL